MTLQASSQRWRSMMRRLMMQARLLPLQNWLH
jgi:hypothetical protein